MTEKELKDSVKAPSGGYFFFGEEDYLKEHYTSLIRRAVITDDSLAVFNEIFFDDNSFSVPSLTDALLSPPLMSEEKLVRVQLSAYSVIPERDKKAFLSCLDSLPDFTGTVLIVTISPDGFDAGTEKRPSAAMKALSSRIKCMNFPLQPEYKLVKWLARHFAKYGIGSDESTLRMMISMCGRSMHRLAGEADKTAAYALSGGYSAISPDIIKAAVTRTPEEDAFRLANALLAGDRAGALESLSGSKRRGENPVRLLASVTSVFCDMAAVAHMAAAGADRRAISSSLKIHEYRVGLYMKASSGIKAEALDAALSMCAEADVKMKSSPLGYIPLERLICSVLRKTSATGY